MSRELVDTAKANLEKLLRDTKVRREIADLLVSGTPFDGVSDHIAENHNVRVKGPLKRLIGSRRGAERFVTENRPGTTRKELDKIYPPDDWTPDNPYGYLT